MCNLHLLPEPGKPACEMSPHGRGCDVQQLRDLGLRPAVRMDHHDADPLQVGQRLQRRQQSRLEVRQLRRPRRWQEALRTPRPAGRSLTYPIQVAGGVLHLFEADPMLPRVRKCLRGGLVANLWAVRGDQRGAKPRANTTDEVIERHNQLKHPRVQNRDSTRHNS